jgi:hypothetical protein
MKHIKISSIIVGLFILAGCDPNRELYEELDRIQKPYHKAIEYTLLPADYSAVGGVVSSIQAFTEDHQAMNYVPGMLSRKFIALNKGSSAMVHFNYLLADPPWLHAGFGYVLTQQDYESLGVPGAFSPAIRAKDNIPGFLMKEFRNMPAGTRKQIIYYFQEGGSVIRNLDVFEFDGADWIWLETRENIPFVGVELKEEDYQAFGGDIARYQNFSDTYPAATYLPVWLKNAYPYAVTGDEKVVKYRLFAGGAATDAIAHFTFDGLQWNKSSDIVPKSEQYVFGVQGWAFDPTTRFIMTQSDYMFLAVIDPIPHATFNDFGYYYGASAFFSNFDMRLVARRTSKDPDGNYWDTALGAIFESGGAEAAVNEMFRRIVEEGLIKLLQNNYLQAVPQSGGIDVHYIVGFETFNDNFSRSYLEAEYRCIAPAVGDTPPQFELIEGPRDRQ